MDKCIIIDFGGVNKSLESKALKYMELSKDSDYKEAISNLYDYLRQAETHDTAKLVLIADILKGPGHEL